MRIVLDDTPLACVAETVGEAVAAGELEARQSGRVIIEIHVDGEPIPVDRFDDPEVLRKPARDVTLLSADLRTLAVETLAQASDALVSAGELQQSAAELIQADDQPQAMEKLGEAIAVWLTVQQAIAAAAQALSIDLAALELEGDSFQIRMNVLQEKLQHLKTALEATDPVGLADMLLFELPECVADWREVIDAISMHADEEAESS